MFKRRYSLDVAAVFGGIRTDIPHSLAGATNCHLPADYPQAFIPLSQRSPCRSALILTICIHHMTSFHQIPRTPVSVFLLIPCLSAQFKSQHHYTFPCKKDDPAVAGLLPCSSGTCKGMFAFSSRATPRGPWWYSNLASAGFPLFSFASPH